MGWQTPARAECKGLAAGAGSSSGNSLIDGSGAPPAAVAKIDTALKQAAVCGETLPSIKEFPEEEPAPAASASQHHSVHTLWSTP